MFAGKPRRAALAWAPGAAEIATTSGWRSESENARLRLAGERAQNLGPLGLAVAGGLFVFQLLTLYITPVFYLYMEQFQGWLNRQHSRETSLTAKAPLSPARTGPAGAGRDR